MSTVSVIIPVYKKLNEFLIFFQHNIQFLRDCEIIIVNDDPQTYLPQDLPLNATEHTNIVWLNHQENQGFGKSVNDAARKATGEYLMLLNTDVKLLDDTWRSALRALENDTSLFAVSFAQKEKDGRIVGRNELYFKSGLFHHRALPFDSAPDNQNGELLPTAWAEGGSTILRKSMWDTLGGFDENYSPFYWEDVDLSYRAKLKGWQVLFSPQIMVEHHHESTIGTQYPKSKITEIAFRNQLYFTSKFAQGYQRIQYSIFKHILLPLQKTKGN